MSVFADRDTVVVGYGTIEFNVIDSKIELANRFVDEILQGLEIGDMELAMEQEDFFKAPRGWFDYAWDALTGELESTPEFYPDYGYFDVDMERDYIEKNGWEDCFTNDEMKEIYKAVRDELSDEDI